MPDWLNSVWPYVAKGLGISVAVFTGIAAAVTMFDFGRTTATGVDLEVAAITWPRPDSRTSGDVDASGIALPADQHNLFLVVEEPAEPEGARRFWVKNPLSLDDDGRWYADVDGAFGDTQEEVRVVRLHVVRTTSPEAFQGLAGREGLVALPEGEIIASIDLLCCDG